MSIDPEVLITWIYEAALVPELWRRTIDATCALSGAATGSIICMNERYRTVRGIASEFAEETFQQFVRNPGSWDSVRVQRGLATTSPMAGSFTPFDRVLNPQELEDDWIESIQREIGIGFQVGTAVHLPSGSAACFTFERWLHEGRHSAAGLAQLDALRPHLARAAMVSAQLGLERARTMIDTLEAVGMPAAALTADGRVLAVNATFEESDLLLPRAFDRIRIASATAQALFEQALQETRCAAAPIVRSIAVPAVADRTTVPQVLHLVPVCGAAHDVFASAALLLVATRFGSGATLPDLPLLHGLFDMTPREAQLCTALAAGHSLKAGAALLGMRFSTARAHLEHIFLKTGTHRQAELVLLLQSAQPLCTPALIR